MEVTIRELIENAEAYDGAWVKVIGFVLPGSVEADRFDIFDGDEYYVKVLVHKPWVDDLELARVMVEGVFKACICDDVVEDDYGHLHNIKMHAIIADTVKVIGRLEVEHGT